MPSLPSLTQQVQFCGLRAPHYRSWTLGLILCTEAECPPRDLEANLASSLQGDTGRFQAALLGAGLHCAVERLVSQV